ncbi:hypothetical protein ES705_24343 [subsurface metagenome]
MVVNYSPETETVEVPIAVIENWDRRLALLQVLLLLLKLLIDDIRAEEQDRRWRILWPVN